MILEIVWLVLAIFHIVPLAGYILYMKYIAERKPWDLKINPNYEPEVSVIIPTYNEATAIKKKLDNILEVDYPKNKMEVIIVDSNSTDGTVDIVRNWINEHSELNVKFIVEDERRGMVHAENTGLKYATKDIIIKTDADCFWFKDSLRKAIPYLADPKVAAVAGLHRIASHKQTSAVRVEETYREFYRWLRLGESKLYSTVLYEGELMLVKKNILVEIGGFDEHIGADDVPLALKLAGRGYRAITAQDAYFMELTPYSWRERFKQKVRRGGHVLQSLLAYYHKVSNAPIVFTKLILPMEIYIYIINPIIFIPLALISMLMVLNYPLLFALSFLLLIGNVRQLVLTHLINVSVMITAIIKQLLAPEPVTWVKIREAR